MTTMTNMTWTSAPADFLREGSSAVRPDFCGTAVGLLAPVPMGQGTGLSAAGIGAVDGQKLTPLAHTNGTTLGIPSPRRSLS